jgi:hypothetical protein
MESAMWLSMLFPKVQCDRNFRQVAGLIGPQRCTMSSCS